MTAGGVPMAGEYEVKNAQAMKIMDAFGTGGSFTEYYATDYNDDIILMGHDEPGHPAIAAGKTKVRPLTVFHGKAGRGLSVEMSVRHGPVTLLSVVDTADGRLELLFAEAESVPGRFSKSATPKPVPVCHGSAPVHQRMEQPRPGASLRNRCRSHIGDRIGKLASLLGVAAYRVY